MRIWKRVWKQANYLSVNHVTVRGKLFLPVDPSTTCHNLLALCATPDAHSSPLHGVLKTQNTRNINIMCQISEIFYHKKTCVNIQCFLHGVNQTDQHPVIRYWAYLYSEGTQHRIRRLHQLVLTISWVMACLLPTSLAKTNTRKEEISLLFHW